MSISHSAAPTAGCDMHRPLLFEEVLGGFDRSLSAAGFTTLQLEEIREALREFVFQF